MIEVKHVMKQFKGKQAVRNVSFTIEQGEIFGFLGPNGAGKTTTSRMMIGLLKPSEGEVWIDGLNVQTDTKKVHERIGVVFELPNLYSKWTVLANLQFFAKLYNVPHDKINEVMASLQLTDRANQKVGSLSKGWKQRVLIARALLHNPKILFLDEPTSGLDPNTARLIRDYIYSLKCQGTTIVMTTHDMNEADELSDRVGIMHKGCLVALDTPQRLKEKFGEDTMVVEYRDDEGVKKEKLPLYSEETTEFLYKKMKDEVVISVHSQEATLADVFAKLTGSELS
ncbi:ABC transporter ATP-binding protein [Bacillus sp. HMF5848]|uniref:ABC transporter ATP-binding protein n=1 Tax=Bacillus sp. HMF5848 TaxID=2495421 RepID=UPI000F774CFE|nr:ABC transporter ATP-binding protein [Bacillus sp. HMF5848]RSK25865.1 ABC transporter ATP-binding protein [Bacillus sp. HMF5848]